MPLVIVDSGNQSSSGPVDYTTTYKQMVDTALVRPPQADLQAYWWRTGDYISVQVKVTNLTAVPLDSENSTTVHAIVYENNKVKLTSRYVRTAVDETLFVPDGLTIGESATVELSTNDLTGVDWDKLAVATLVDYQPNGSGTAFDTLQATHATKIDTPFSATTTAINLLADPDAGPRPQTITFQGIPGLTWYATPNADWLIVTPTNGPLTTAPTLSVDMAKMQSGRQLGTVQFTASDNSYSAAGTARYHVMITVDGYLGDINDLWLPAIRR